MKEDQNLNILVVEDEPTIESLVSLGLRYEHYAVTPTGDGITGLQLFEEHHPALVIRDWLLPGMDGLKLCRLIRSQSDVHIIMITARDAIRDRVDGLETGADDSSSSDDSHDSGEDDD